MSPVTSIENGAINSAKPFQGVADIRTPARSACSHHHSTGTHSMSAG
jgi:hypothetical protein